MQNFTYTTSAQQISFGAGALSSIGEIVQAFGWQRLMLCTSPSQRRNGAVSALERALGKRLVASYEQVKAHVLDYQLAEALTLADQQAVDAVIGLGGGSAIGMAKAVALALEGKRTGQTSVHSATPTEQPLIPNIAIPTTYAGSEMTPIYGITQQQEDGSTRKLTVSDGKIAPKVVLYDPQLTLTLPADVTAATGINALAHCIEALYSTTRNPLSSAAALEGIRHIASALPRCFTQGDDLTARTSMLLGAHLGGIAIATVELGVHHGTCHVLGGTAGLAHGVANSIMLPHAMRFNLDTVAPQLAQVAVAMGVNTQGISERSAAEAAIQHVYDLISQLGTPQRLRDAGVTQAMLQLLAENMLKSKAVRSNPRPVPDRETALQLLQAAW